MFTVDIAACLQEADNFRSMVLDYAAADFPPMGSAEIPDRNKAATDALSLFLSCRWSRMNNFEVMLIHNALGCLYREGACYFWDNLYSSIVIPARHS